MPNSAQADRPAGVSFLLTQRVKDALKDEMCCHSEAGPQSNNHGLTLTWSGWSGRKVCKARTTSPGIAPSLRSGEEVPAEILCQEFKDSGMPQRSRDGHRSPRGSPSPQQRTSAGDGFAGAPEPGASPTPLTVFHPATGLVADIRSKRRPGSSPVRVLVMEPPTAGELAPARETKRGAGNPLPAQMSHSTSAKELSAGGSNAMRLEVSLLQLRGAGAGAAGSPLRPSGRDGCLDASGRSSVSGLRSPGEKSVGSDSTAASSGDCRRPLVASGEKKGLAMGTFHERVTNHIAVAMHQQEKGSI